jgi:hypothetical protein
MPRKEETSDSEEEEEYSEASGGSYESDGGAASGEEDGGDDADLGDQEKMVLNPTSARDRIDVSLVYCSCTYIEPSCLPNLRCFNLIIVT